MLIAVAAVVAGVYIYMLREYGGKEIFYFNDALNTFYSDGERGNPLQPHRLLFPISSNVFLYASSHRHTTAFVTPVVEHWLEREIAQCVHPMKNRSDDPSHHERTLLPV